MVIWRLKLKEEQTVTGKKTTKTTSEVKYKVDKKDEKKSKKKFSLKDFLKKIDKRIWLGIIIVAAILIIVLTIYIVLIVVDANKYNIYEAKVVTYGFDKLYDNGKVESSNFVSKSEAVKMAIATVLNKTDLFKEL